MSLAREYTTGEILRSAAEAADKWDTREQELVNQSLEQMAEIRRLDSALKFAERRSLTVQQLEAFEKSNKALGEIEKLLEPCVGDDPSEADPIDTLRKVVQFYLKHKETK